MRVLHLFANHKFTGPADPALELASQLQTLGLDVQFAAGRDPRPSTTGVRALAAARGLSVIDELALPKHGHPYSLWRDIRTLTRILSEAPPDIIHCHLPSDHFTAARAAASGSIPLVRTVYDAEVRPGLRARLALKRSAAVLVFSPTTRASVQTAFPGYGGRFETLDPSVDLERFAGSGERGWRDKWNLDGDAVVVGVVARMQTHRLFPELIAGFRTATEIDPRLHLVILGRGTHQEKVAHEPARASGVGERIHFPGYVGSDDYPAVLRSFDMLLFLVPGSDGTCRAAREALVCGLPVVSSRRGLLPEFIEDNENGLLLAEESPEAIAAALLKLTRDEGLRRRLGDNAARLARARFDPARQARRVHDIYQSLLAGAGNSS